MTADSLRPPKCPGNARRRRQAGYLLLEAAIVAALMASAVLAYFSFMSLQERIDKGEIYGSKYARINEGLGRYMTLHYEALKKLHPDCSIHGLAYQMSKTKPVGLDCRVLVNKTRVTNGLQPTTVELVALGLLPEGTTDSLGLTTTKSVSQPDEDGNTAEDNWTRARLMAVITQACVATRKTVQLGRYVLVRRYGTMGNLALDEIEVIVNGSNIASSANITSSTIYTDGAANAAAYYGTANLVDRLVTGTPPATGQPYELPGLFRSVLDQNSDNVWVQLDLGSEREISSVGVRSALGNPDRNDQKWEQDGNSVTVRISYEEAVNGSFVPTGTSKISVYHSLADIQPGIMRYINSGDFYDQTPTDLTPTSQGCPANSIMVLSSLLFNSQPYYLEDSMGAGAMMASITSAAGTEAAMSRSAGDVRAGGELMSSLFTMPNPLRYYDPDDPTNTTGIGLAGIIAVRNGYTSFNTSLQTRVDGSNLPTAAWNFNAKNLTGVGNFESTSANVGDLTAQGALSANKGSFNELKLPTASAGGTCNSLTQSLSQNAAGALLTCANNLWTSSVPATVNPLEFNAVFFTYVLAAGTIGNVNYSPETLYYANQLCIPAGCGLGQDGQGYVHASSFLTSLKTSEWFPVLLSQGANGGSRKTNYKITSTTGGTWKFDVEDSGNASWVVYFYKINP